jgi:hypothetical protein
MDFLRFALSSFWHFVGVFMLIGVTLNGLAQIVAAWRTGRVPK